MPTQGSGSNCPARLVAELSVSAYRNRAGRPSFWDRRRFGSRESSDRAGDKGTGERIAIRAHVRHAAAGTRLSRASRWISMVSRCSNAACRVARVNGEIAAAIAAPRSRTRRVRKRPGANHAGIAAEEGEHCRRIGSPLSGDCESGNARASTTQSWNSGCYRAESSPWRYCLTRAPHDCSSKARQAFIPIASHCRRREADGRRRLRHFGSRVGAVYVIDREPRTESVKPLVVAGD